MRTMPSQDPVPERGVRRRRRHRAVGRTQHAGQSARPRSSSTLTAPASSQPILRFQGQLAAQRAPIRSDYKALADWSATPALWRRDLRQQHSIRRAKPPPTPPLRRTAAYIIRPTTKPISWRRYDVNLRGAATTATAFVTNIDYNAKGQRTLIEYGNDTQTTYEYDPKTFRLDSSSHDARLRTPRTARRFRRLSYRTWLCL